MVVQKRLLTEDDLQKWLNSETYESVVSFVTQLGEAVNGKENAAYEQPISSQIENLCALLDTVAKIVDKHPVVQDKGTSRFGKVEFRDFYDEVRETTKELISSLSSELTDEQVEELAVYFTESWGDRKRIDYGSGHELNFICFLYGLTHYSVLSDADKVNLVLKVFIKYLDVMRLLETKYWLEPAGSHGVWGLDDYHFLPFLFGAFQLTTHKHLKPKSIHNPEIVEVFEKRYMYFECVAFINKVKTTASLRWHSPMLDDISGVRTWSKVAEGMVKMYKAEVLGKLPIMQHFFFSTFLPGPENVSAPRDGATDDAHCISHSHGGWGDCCGIPIPSAIAATELNRRRGKPLPFD
ncbi:peptidylprolyl isomerase RRD2 Ecym_2399 [Eremothecium cymbalariae DBVPG|uniref:Serine/threonine-protein phosphatase 2A activator n=1 Tax=Eremothecium cymbalariae (strain CBS 270.75 / DBVPG 7215 / KCTC 17166 / NRRL Y-17582) TaxID=931890 RepID=G8JNR4_ERECY|nr:Hypothetical protein Ecym_2399 [Eremothecium cymbalariae DBVPG\